MRYIFFNLLLLGLTSNKVKKKELNLDQELVLLPEDRMG